MKIINFFFHLKPAQKVIYGERYHGIVNIRAKNYIPSTILGVLQAHAVLTLHSIVLMRSHAYCNYILHSVTTERAKQGLPI